MGDRDTTIREVGGNGERSVTLREVALKAGVNQATVSVVLNGSKSNTVVSGPTRERIASAAQELGYWPNSHAQQLARGGAPSTVALVLGYIDAGVHARQMMAIRNQLIEGGQRVPVYIRSSIFTEEKAVSDLLENVCRQGPRAIVSSIPDSRSGQLRRYCEQGGIVVHYEARLDNQGDEPFDSVAFDTSAAIEAAARHLLELGHSKIGFFNGGDERWEGLWMDGFSRALADFGLEVRDDWRFCGGDSLFRLEEGGADLATQFLALPRHDRPTGMCVINDSAAVTFIAALELAGLQIPRDLSVIGFDDLPIARLNRLPLSSVEKPLTAIASHVAALLGDRLSGACTGLGRQIRVAGEVRVRDSTGPPPEHLN